MAIKVFVRIDSKLRLTYSAKNIEIRLVAKSRMAENLEKEFEIKSRLLTELQKLLDEKLETIGKLELDMTEKIEQVRGLEQSLGGKTRKVNELQAELDKKTAVIGPLETQLQAAQNELSQYKEEIESIKNLRSYKMGKRFGKVFGGAAESGTAGPDSQGGKNKPDSQDASQKDSQAAGPDSDGPDGAGPGRPAEPDLYESTKSKLSAYEKANLISRRRQRLASTKFAHGEDLSMSPSLLDLCIDSKSNMLDDWQLICLCSCIKNFDWKGGDYLVEIGTNIGQGAVFMAKVLEELGLDTKIISIDPFSFAAKKSFNPKGNYSQYVTLTRQQNLQDRCIPVTAFSQHIPDIFKERVGVLVVDGSHQYEDVRKDLDYYCRLVRPNGYVFVDDVFAEIYPGVYGAFNEWLSTHDDFELSYKGESFAIAKKTAP